MNSSQFSWTFTLPHSHDLWQYAVFTLLQDCMLSNSLAMASIKTPKVKFKYFHSQFIRHSTCLERYTVLSVDHDLCIVSICLDAVLTPGCCCDCAIAYISAWVCVDDEA